MDRRFEYVPDVVTFLARHFGLQCSFEDPEQEVLVMRMDDLSGDELLDALSQYGHAVKGRLCRDHNRQLAIFVGGPENGKPHMQRIPHGYGYHAKGHAIPVHVGRAKWAAYRIGDDHLRAWFCGYATSKKKARLLTVKREGAKEK